MESRPLLLFSCKGMNSVRRLLFTVLLVQLGPSTHLPQSLAQESNASSRRDLKFEVVSIKVDESGAIPRNRLFENRYVISNMPLFAIICNAYGVTPDQLSNVPRWVRLTNYRIEATLDEKTAAYLKSLSPPRRTEQIRQMMRSVLSDRFSLRIHSFEEQQKVYELRVLPGGPKFKASVPGETYADGIDDGEVSGSGTTKLSSGALIGQDIPMAAFVNNLQFLAQRMVVDRTGLQGRYDIKLTWDPNLGFLPSLEASQSSQGSSIFTSIHDQLGLTLQPAKAKVEMIMLDSIESPSQN